MKLIAIDLDGTLLSDDGSISQENIHTIHAVQKQGDMIAISSGRSFQDTAQILQLAGIDCPIMTGNGAKSYHDGKQLQTLALTVPVISEMISILEQRGLYYEIYTKDGVLIEEGKKEILNNEIEQLKKRTTESLQWAVDIVDIQFNQHGLTFVSDYKAIDFTNSEVYKLFVLSFDTQKLRKLRSDLTEKKDISLTSSGDQKLEIGHVEASKGNALKLMADYLKVPLENTVAIGDNLNDLSMFQVAGQSVAMENAEDEVKMKSTYTTKAYYEDGVAYALKKYILKNE